MLGDDHLFKEGKVTTDDLFYSLVSLSRAHDKYVNKSRRIGAAWAKNRIKAQSEPITKRCPAWLEAIEGPDKRYAFVVNKVERK